jgi:phosphoglycerate kinase
MKLATISSLRNLRGRRVLLRVDFNIPIGPGGHIGPAEDIKLRASLPTIQHLLKGGAKVIAVSHLGRPKGCDEKFSLKPVAAHLGKLLGQKVLFVDKCLEDGNAVEKRLAKMADGQLALLENIRFYDQEEENDPEFAARLASLADVFVNDAFAAAHRAHASTAGVTKYLKSYAGLLLENEIKNLDRLLKQPKKPFYVLMGGAKISSKMPTLEKMLRVASKVFIGGGMANNFFKAQGCEVGRSLVSPEDVKLAKKLLKNKKLVVPKDVLAATSLKDSANVRVCLPSEVKKTEYIVDIGTRTMREFALELKQAQTLVWNGPVGLFEVKKFSHGSVILGRVIAARSKGRAFGVVGGGETIACLEKTGMSEFVDHVSTGGGAMLDYLSGKVLPGIKPLLKK